VPKRKPEVTSRIMAAVRSRDTVPELLLAKALRRLKLRFSRCAADLTGTPDLVFRTRAVAVFVDGDFWHGNSWRLRGCADLEGQFRKWRRPGFWLKKIRDNIARDRRVNRALRKDGWRVLRVWESQILKDPGRCARRIHEVVGEKRGLAEQR
jgi:DNA mismatch endonuclease, patch repair protein